MFFFFKQKTAYEMRISDWSSDVCSSDLDRVAQVRVGRRERRGEGHDAARRFGAEISVSPAWWPGAVRPFPAADFLMLYSPLSVRAELVEAPSFFRSEEHTSELQSLMRISYAVFCLKKKKIINYTI